MTEIDTASRKDVAGFLRLLRNKGGAVNVESFLKEEKGRYVAADRALNEQLVRGCICRGKKGGDPEIAGFKEVHLTTAGEKLLRHWRWRWWWRGSTLVAGLMVTAESCVSLFCR